MSAPAAPPEGCPAAEDFSAIAYLPFVISGGGDSVTGGRVFWQPHRTGDEATDWVLGDAFARQAIQAAVEDNEPLLFAWIIEDLVAAGRFDALERRFVTGLTAAHMSGEGRR